MRPVIEFSLESPHPWRIVNDGVMGGRSRSRITVDDGSATFEGEVSLENNGGFASVSTWLGRTDLSEWDGIALWVEGSGRTFQLRIRTDANRDGVVYRARFETSVEGAGEIHLPFREFEATWRGRSVPGAEPLDPSKIEQIGFLIADGQQGSFRLRVSWIRAYRDADRHEARSSSP